MYREVSRSFYDHFKNIFKNNFLELLPLHNMHIMYYVLLVFFHLIHKNMHICIHKEESLPRCCQQQKVHIVRERTQNGRISKQIFLIVLLLFVLFTIIKLSFSEDMCILLPWKFFRKILLLFIWKLFFFISVQSLFSIPNICV